MTVLDYHPRNMYHWDFWMIAREGHVHSFYLFRLRPGAVADPHGLDWIGHAVTDDLINWREEPPIIPPGPPGALDDMKHWTGHIIEKDQLYYLFYTGRSSREAGQVQRTMLATSPDLYNWTKYENNPVLEADARWYLAQQTPERDHVVGWRAPRVVLDESSGWYYAFLAADLPEGEYAERGCVARARSRDLLNWEIMPPAFAPHKYATIEVPDVFYLDGRWYMTLLTGTAYGNPRGTLGEPSIEMGTIYAVADSLDGEFREPANNVLIGARWWEGTSCRSVAFADRLYLFYFQCEREGGSDAGPFNWGRLTTPKELRTTPDGALHACYSSLIEQKVSGVLLNGMSPTMRDSGRQFGLGNWLITAAGARGSCRSGWSATMTEQQGRDFILTAMVTMREGLACGLLFHTASFSAAYAVLLDFERQELLLTRLREFDPLQSRPVPLAYNRPYLLRVVAKAEFYEIYLDDVLLINCVRYALPSGSFGLLVERGVADFAALHALELGMGAAPTAVPDASPVQLAT